MCVHVSFCDRAEVAGGWGDADAFLEFHEGIEGKLPERPGCSGGGKESCGRTSVVRNEELLELLHVGASAPKRKGTGKDGGGR